jgi:broad specificity phosphatase PhoE
VAAYQGARERVEINRAFQKLFEAVVHLWSEDALGVDGIEPWKDFTSRVERGIGSITGGEKRSRRVLAFSSVGPITIFLKYALATTDRKALELGWRLRNCSVCEFVFTDGRITLDCFNALPHLDRAELITFR